MLRCIRFRGLATSTPGAPGSARCKSSAANIQRRMFAQIAVPRVIRAWHSGFSAETVSRRSNLKGPRDLAADAMMHSVSLCRESGTEPFLLCPSVILITMPPVTQNGRLGCVGTSTRNYPGVERGTTSILDILGTARRRAALKLPHRFLIFRAKHHYQCGSP